jgi:hypothetical protein
MRENRWMPRKLVTPDGPRTIQQVEVCCAVSELMIPDRGRGILLNPD